MLVSYRQPLGHRQPLRVGRLLYWRLWLGHCLDRLGAELRPAWQRLADGCRAVVAPLRWLAVASARVVDRVRPRPLTDEGLLVLVAVLALGTLALAAGLGYGVAHWMLTVPQDVLVAGVAVVVGVALLALMFLVFGARRDRRPRRSAARGTQASKS